MQRPHRTATGSTPDEVRCGRTSGLTNGELRERRQVAGILTAIGAVLTGAAVALSALPGSAHLVGQLPDLAARPAAAAAAEIDPQAPPPRRITVERIGVDIDLVNLGLDRAGELQVPEDAAVPGWYRGGAAPGDRGPAVLVGHVDSFEGPGIFFRLRELVPGDRVTVTRIDGSVVTFEVYGAETVDKDAFPTDRVYGATDGAELRLLTCGGAFDREARSYTDNVVVYARQV